MKSLFRHPPFWIVLSTLALPQACASHPEGKVNPAYEVRKNQVMVHGRGPVRFDVASAVLGPALPLPPVTARVTTVEALTSPSFSPLSGRVVEASVRLGDHVEKGQKLVLIRTADLSTLERDLRAAELAVQTDKANVARLRELVESRAGSQNDLIVGESELAQAKLAEKAARARLQSLQVGKGDDTSYWVLALRSGTVVQLDAVPGLQVGPDRTSPIATVADLAEVMVVGDVPQRDATSLQKGAPAKVYPFGPSGESIDGTIEVVSEVVDPDRQTVPVRVHVANAAHKLRPNAFVDLSFGSTDPQKVVLVPTAAVVRDGATAVVFVQTREGSFEKRPVVLGRQGREQVEVLEGVAPHELVVTNGALLLLNAIDIKA